MQALNTARHTEGHIPGIFIVVKFKVQPEWSERWLGLVEDFIRATRKEPGPRIISRQVDGDGSDLMGELTI